MKKLILSKVIVSIIVFILLVLIYILSNNTQYEILGYIANSMICMWYGSWMAIINDWFKEHELKESN